MYLDDKLFAGQPGGTLFTQLVSELLMGSELCSWATTNPDGTPHANTAYFAFDERLTLYVLTPPTTSHGSNIAVAAASAVTVFDSHQPWGLPHRGLQLFGKARVLTGCDQDRAFDVYAARFPELLELAPTSADVTANLESRFYAIAVAHLKLIDEPANGAESCICLEVRRT